MLNLDQELKQLETLSETMLSAIHKTHVSLSGIDTQESKELMGFIKEVDEVMKSGKGEKELQQKIQEYARNR